MFVVLDAIDGAGKGAQRIEVLKYLRANKSMNIDSEEFPVHNDFYEMVVHPALQQETKMNDSSWILSFLLDKTLQAERISDYVGNSENLFLADGYFTTTIAYQSKLMNQITANELERLGKLFKIPKPDLCIYIDVDPNIAMKRKELEEGHDEGLDLFEKDLKKQEDLRAIYKEMVDKQHYSRWIQVDGHGTIEEVRSRIIEILEKEVL